MLANSANWSSCGPDGAIFVHEVAAFKTIGKKDIPRKKKILFWARDHLNLLNLAWPSGNWLVSISSLDFASFLETTPSNI